MELCDMPFDINEITFYNPLQNKVSVFPKKNVKEYTERLSYNKFKFIDISGNVKTCFKKFITLVDYVKYLIGKYKPEEINQLPNKEHLESTSQFQEYIHSINNYAYVDGFFYYLTSKLLNAGFVHGLEFYDNYVCLTKNCEINITDDFEYLCDSIFFNENMNSLFHFKDDKFNSMFKKNDPINISDETVEIVADDIDDLNDNIVIETTNVLINADEIDDYESVNGESVNGESIDCESLDCESVNGESVNGESLDASVELDNEFIDNGKSENKSNHDDDSNDNGSDHSTVDYSDSESESKSDDNASNQTEVWETDSDNSECETDNDNENENENLLLVINKIPTNVIAIECCESTFDSILENNEITIEELESAMFQVIAMLYLYQQAFKFTHNDLHTNNIMFVSTTKEFLHYKILGKYYKIPTYGKIYKIIDFGRSIYTVNNTLLCSDSFSPNGTAHTQYNCEPFYNPNKPIIEPNYSFDLCRLACSMLDFIIDDFKCIETYRKVPVYDLIISWLYDDNGVNVLYKKNGEERYPEFKLYKMIARIVHNHTPEKQFSHVCFKSYETDVLEDCMDLDEIKKQVHL
jgi:hypothetical protein